MALSRPLKPAPRVARAPLPFGGVADAVIERMEGYKRRTKGGMFTFSDSVHNLQLVRAQWPDMPIDLEIEPFERRQVPPLGKYLSSTRYPLYAHQKAALIMCASAPAYALFMEMGTGKTRVAIDKAGRHFCRGEVTGAMVITFKGVHRQWAMTQIPQHMGTLNGAPLRTSINVWENKPIDFDAEYREPGPVMEWFCTTYSGIDTVKGRETVAAFMARHQGTLMVIVDESHGIKQYDTVRTQNCVEIGKLASVKLILTGTPIPSALEDEWSQSVFLSEEIFGLRYVSSFRNEYTYIDKFTNKRMSTPAQVAAFNERMQPYAFRVTKAEALDLPPKIYETFEFDLTKANRTIYRDLRRSFLAQLEGEEFTVKNAAVLLMRLQQITCGVLIGEDEGQVAEIGTEREEALAELLQKYDEQSKVCIWSRFKRDIQKVHAVCAKFGEVVDYEGATSNDARTKAVVRFMEDPNCKFFNAMAAVGGTGLNLQGECATAIYYSNSFNSVERWQSEDRFHRIGTVKPITYVDLMCQNTVDIGILNSLRNKKDFADLVLDSLKGG